MLICFVDNAFNIKSLIKMTNELTRFSFVSELIVGMRLKKTKTSKLCGEFIRSDAGKEE